MNTYSERYFKGNQEVALSSAREIVPLILRLVKVTRVIDLGCANGEFLRVFKENGVKEVVGVDGNWVSRKNLMIESHDFVATDLKRPIKMNKKFDLALSLEVAEHLPQKCAKNLVKSLTSLSPVILFSAAIPYQGGENHLNEQWPYYWIDLFRKRGYECIDCIRLQIWNNPRVAFWYAQNALIFVKKDKVRNYPALKKQFSVDILKGKSLVHPKLYAPSARMYDKVRSLFPKSLRRTTFLLKLINKSS